MAHIFELCYLGTCKNNRPQINELLYCRNQLSSSIIAFTQKENSNAGAYKKYKEDRICFHLKGLSLIGI